MPGEVAEAGLLQTLDLQPSDGFRTTVNLKFETYGLESPCACRLGSTSRGYRPSCLGEGDDVAGNP